METEGEAPELEGRLDAMQGETVELEGLPAIVQAELNRAIEMLRGFLLLMK